MMSVRHLDGTTQIYSRDGGFQNPGCFVPAQQFRIQCTKLAVRLTVYAQHQVRRSCRRERNDDKTKKQTKTLHGGYGNTKQSEKGKHDASVVEERFIFVRLSLTKIKQETKSNQQQ